MVGSKDYEGRKITRPSDKNRYRFVKANADGSLDYIYANGLAQAKKMLKSENVYYDECIVHYIVEDTRGITSPMSSFFKRSKRVSPLQLINKEAYADMSFTPSYYVVKQTVEFHYDTRATKGRTYMTYGP